MVADGFGIHAKLVGSVQPDPQTGQVTAHFDDLPQVPFDDFNLHLFASDRGLMATPTQLHASTTTEADFFPWNTALPEVRLEPDLQPRLGPARQPTAPARSGPSSRASPPAPRTRSPAPSPPSR